MAKEVIGNVNPVDTISKANTALQPVNNLSELTDMAVARDNLEVLSTSEVSSTYTTLDASAAGDAANTILIESETNSREEAVNSITDALTTKADLIDGVVPTSQIPGVALTTGRAVANRAAMLALGSLVQEGDIASITGTSDKGTYLLGPGDPTIFESWLKLSVPTDVVQSINGQIGVVVLAAADVGAVAQVTSVSRVYVHDGSGNESTIGYSQLANNSSIAQRNSAGQLVAANPTAASHLTTKGYIDVPILNLTHAGTTLDLSSYIRDTVINVLLNANVTGIILPAHGTIPYALELNFTQGATPRTVVWPSTALFSYGLDPILTATVGSIDQIYLESNGSVWLGKVGGLTFA